MPKKRLTSNAGEVMRRRYYQGKSKERIALANANIQALALGDKIQLLREQAGLTQSQLAAKIGTQPSQISRVEAADDDGHSIGTLRRIAVALHKRLRIEFVADEAGWDGVAGILI